MGSDDLVFAASLTLGTQFYDYQLKTEIDYIYCSLLNLKEHFDNVTKQLLFNTL